MPVRAKQSTKMAVRGTLPRHLLLPLLVCCAGCTVDSQTVNFTNVSTEYFEVFWERRGEWLGIDDFTVSTVTLGGTQHPCTESFSCTTPVCRFLSLECGFLNPCSSVNVSVSGGNYTAPELILTTAPQVFRDVTVNITSANLTISWTNPAVEEPTCLKEANILLVFNKVGTVINSSDVYGSYWKMLCKESVGQVLAWNVGGDGVSDVVSQNISYQGSDVVPLVDNVTATPGCSNLTVTWVYNDICPEATHFLLSLSDDENIYYTKDTNTTTHVFQGLSIAKWYYVDVEVLDKDNRSVGASDHVSTQTLGAVVESLTAEAVSWSAINLTWLPPLCNSDPNISYLVWIIELSTNSYYGNDITFNTSYTWNNLNNNYCYKVCVIPGNKHEKCLEVSTLLERPNFLRVEDSPTDELLVTWSYQNCPYTGCNIVNFIVSWGPILENTVNTYDTKFTISGYDAAVEDRRVCVAAFNTETQDVSSNTCLGDPDVDPNYTEAPAAPSRANPGLVMGLSCFAVILVAGVIISAVVHIRNKRRLPIIRAASRPTELKNVSENGRQ